MLSAGDFGVMGFRRRSRGSWFLFPWLVISLLLFLQPLGPAASQIAVNILKAPPRYSSLSSADFVFEAGDLCANCSISCKLDNFSSSNCKSREVSYSGLPDGDHIFEVCINGYGGVHCVNHNWTVDTVPPTAYVSASSSFTNALNVSVRISFSEPCPGGGGFRCSLIDCNLLVYGAGHVLPSTLKVLQPELEFSLVVGIAADIQFGRLVLVMDKSFCTDAAGNRFTRTSNSSFFLHFDRRNVLMTLKTRVPEKLFQLNGALRTAEATNNNKDLRVYLKFSEPVLNSSAEILGVLHTSSGLLFPRNISSIGNRRFGYILNNLSTMAIVTITCDTSSVISRQGTPVSPSDAVTFLYDTQRPSVKLSTISKMRTRASHIPILINFVKPVFDFNSSAISISGGHLLSFHEVSMSMYSIEIHADHTTVSVEVPENAVADVAGNKNLVSNRLQVRHYTVPIISYLVPAITTIVFLATMMVVALLAIATASLLSSGAFSRSTTYLISEPSRNLLRIAFHIQIFALTKWLAVTLPIEYLEFVRGLEWSIPYLSLPWENVYSNAISKDPSFSIQKYNVVLNKRLMTSKPSSNGKLEMDNSMHKTPLTPMEYRSFLENQNLKPEAEFFLDSHDSNWWIYFGRNMFWLAVIAGGLMVLHATILLILKLRRKNSKMEKDLGALVFPRFEIFLVMLALPCICQASATIIRGGSTSGVIVGVLLLGFTSCFLLSLFLFLSLGITMGKLLQYKEVHHEGQKFHWYQEIIRVILGPGKRGQWTWKSKPNSALVTKLGPLFEDLRGPPKYMLSQISSRGNQERHRDQIIDSDDETEDAEAPFIQKLFGILRIYYTLLESVKRVSLGVVAGAYSSSSRPSRVPTLVVLSITSFQLFFLVLKKPFIKEKLQFVEIVSVASELCVFISCLVLFEKKFSDINEKRMGVFMIALFIIGFFIQIINELYALYRQVVHLSPGNDSFISGLKMVLSGFLLIVLPTKLLPESSKRISSNHGDRVPGASDQIPSSSETSDKPWIRQLRELAKASFSKEDRRSPNDPSSSTNRWSGFWSGKRSGNPSMATSSDSKANPDFKARSKEMYKDLEAIFSSK